MGVWPPPGCLLTRPHEDATGALGAPSDADRWIVNTVPWARGDRNVLDVWEPARLFPGGRRFYPLGPHPTTSLTSVSFLGALSSNISYWAVGLILPWGLLEVCAVLTRTGSGTPPLPSWAPPGRLRIFPRTRRVDTGAHVLSRLPGHHQSMTANYCHSHFKMERIKNPRCPHDGFNFHPIFSS